MSNCAVGVLIRQSPVKFFHVREHTEAELTAMCTATSYDPLLLLAQDVAVVCPKAVDSNNFLKPKSKSKKMR